MRTVNDIYAVLMLLIFPLWLSPGGYTDITRWKFGFFVSVTVLWAVLLIFFAVRGRFAPRFPRSFALIVALGLAWSGVSAALSGEGVSLLGYRYDGLLVYALYALILLGFAGYGQFRKCYVYLVAASSTLCCILAVLQLCALNPLGLYPEGMDYYDSGVLYTGSFLGTVGNTNILGVFLCLSCLLTAFTALKYRGRDLLLLLPSALCAAVAALSKSEAAVLGIAAGLLVGLPYYVNQLGLRRRTLMLLIGEAALVLALLAWVYFAAPAGGTLYEMHELLHGRVQDSFGSSRVAIWREAVRLLAERPLTGGGPGTFGLRSTLEFSRYVAETGMTITTHADNAHCEVLAILVDTGLPGAAAFIAVCAMVLRRSFRRGSAALFALLAGCAAQSFFVLGTCLIMPVICIFAGLAMADDEALAI